MRKFLSAIMCAIMMFSSFSVFAANGDVVGKIYSTDIKACINGVWVESYNIGGRTVVIAEDVTKLYKYSDDLRTLIIDDFSPENLIAGENSSTQKPGTVIGNIYETDIKTYFRGKELTAYSLDGKMAIVIEELGDDNVFSDIGGKFTWNPDDRTIVLESMYRYPYSMRRMMEKLHYNIVLTESDDGLIAQPVPAPLDGGYILCEKETPDNSMIPVIYNDEIIGYRCKFPEKRFAENEDGCALEEFQTPIEYFYIDKFEEMIFQAGDVQITAQDWLNYYKNHTLMTVKDSFETDEYIFLYSFFSGIHEGTDALIKLKTDGTKVNYADYFESVSRYGGKRFDDVIIDKENEKVYLHYDVDYVIDLKTDEIKPYDKEVIQ